MGDFTKDATPPRRRLTADAVAGAITLTFGVALSIVAFGIEPSAFGNAVLQPRDLPLVCGVGLALAGATLLVQGVRQKRGWVSQDPAERVTGGGRAASDTDASSVVDDAVAEATPADNKRNVIALAVMLLGYVLTFIPLGYVVATATFLFVGSTYFSPGKLRRNLLFSVLLPIGVYILFTWVLGVVLPKGILEPIL